MKQDETSFWPNYCLRTVSLVLAVLLGYKLGVDFCCLSIAHLILF